MTAFLVISSLILLNALFAMSEMALTASRKARLQVMVEAGDGGAQAAMDLHDNPTKFLSVVQIGITAIGILNGIVGDAAFSVPFALWLQETFALNDRAAEYSATALIVVVITFVTIIFGELVPKRIGQMYPEAVARLVEAAAELNDEQKAAISQIVAEVTGKTPVLIVRVRPELIGGLVVHVTDRVIDTSIRTKLRTLRNNLLARGLHEIQSRRDRFSDR